MAYVSRKEHAIVDTRLYLPAEWAKDRGRREEAGVPETIEFQTRHELALEMLKECGGRLPHTWVAGDDEMGRPSGFRQELRTNIEPADPRHRGDTAGVLGAGTTSQGPLRAVGSLVQSAAGGRLDQDRCA
jgi:hypothetical protein